MILSAQLVLAKRYFNRSFKKKNYTDLGFELLNMQQFIKVLVNV